MNDLKLLYNSIVITPPPPHYFIVIRTMFLVAFFFFLNIFIFESMNIGNITHGKIKPGEGK